jgi:hypothetical protein
MWASSRCSRAGKVERNGKPYCNLHDPVKVAEKRAARDAMWRAEWAAKYAAQAEAARQKAFAADCVEAIRLIAGGHNDPHALAVSVLVKYSGVVIFRVPKKENEMDNLNSENSFCHITDSMVQAFWEYLPGPYEIDLEDRNAALVVIAAVLAAKIKSPPQ